MERDTDQPSPTILSTKAAVVGRPLLEELEQYWRDLRGARRLPVRTEVNPAQIDAILPYSFILERVSPGNGRLRVAGQSLTTLLGMDARGMPLSVFFSAEARPLLADHRSDVALEVSLHRRAECKHRFGIGPLLRRREGRVFEQARRRLRRRFGRRGGAGREQQRQQGGQQADRAHDFMVGRRPADSKLWHTLNFAPS